MSDDNRVEPADTARSACRRTVFTADFTDVFPVVIKQLGREGAVTDAGCMCLTDADHVFHICSTDAAADSHVTCNRVAGRNERVRTMIHIEHDTLCTFK